MKNRLFRFTLLIAVCFIFGSTKIFAQCGADGTQPCKTTPKKTPPKTTTPKKTTPAKTTVVPKKQTTAKKPMTTVSRTQPNPVSRMPQIEFVKIPAGEFMMGSNDGESDEKPVHKVTISKEFYMGKYEITQAQYRAVMGTNPSYFKNCGNCPVERVSWEDAQSFIRKMNAQNDGYKYRLPTEAEWEYAARAGTSGDYAGNLDSMAWYDSNSGDKTHEVGTKSPNGWGLYDMHGNVWEWCQDWYGNYSSGSVTDPTGASSGSSRVVRGGGWDAPADVLRSAHRSYDTPSERGGNLGFRLLRQ